MSYVARVQYPMETSEPFNVTLPMSSYYATIGSSLYTGLPAPTRPFDPTTSYACIKDPSNTKFCFGEEEADKLNEMLARQRAPRNSRNNTSVQKWDRCNSCTWRIVNGIEKGMDPGPPGFAYASPTNETHHRLPAWKRNVADCGEGMFSFSAGFLDRRSRSLCV